MELFKGKESFKEKINSDNNWKTARPKMFLDWDPFLTVSLGFIKKIRFVGKHPHFYPKDVC